LEGNGSPAEEGVVRPHDSVLPTFEAEITLKMGLVGVSGINKRERCVKNNETLLSSLA